MALVQEWELWLSSPAHTTSLPLSLQTVLVSASSRDCLAAVAYIKRLIKDRSRFPTLKFRALDSLCTAMDIHHPVFAAAVAKKLLRRLVLFAQYKKELRSESRGATLFAGRSLSSAEETSASVAFLTRLLAALRSWPDLRVEGKEKAAFREAYRSLVREGVTFPREDEAKSERKTENSVLKRHKETGTALLKLIQRESTDPTSVQAAADAVHKSFSVVQAELQTRLNKGTDVQEILQVCEHLNECLTAYQCWRPVVQRSHTVPEKGSIPQACLKPDSQLWARALPEPQTLPAPVDNSEDCVDMDPFFPSPARAELEFSFEEEEEVEAEEVLRLKGRVERLGEEKAELVERLRQQEEALASTTHRLAGLNDTLTTSQEEVLSLLATLQVTSQQLQDTQQFAAASKTSLALLPSPTADTELTEMRQKLQLAYDLYLSGRAKVDTLTGVKAALQASVERAEVTKQQLKAQVRELHGVRTSLAKAQQRQKTVESEQTEFDLEALQRKKEELERKLKATKEKVAIGSQLLSSLRACRPASLPSPADNELQWRESLGQKRGLLYRDEEVEAGYRSVLCGPEGTVLVYVVNRGSEELAAVEIEAEAGSGYALTVALRKLPQHFQHNSQIDVLLSFACFEPFTSSPMLRLRYRHPAGPRQLLLKLPLTCVDLIRPLSSPSHVEAMWSALASCEVTQELSGLERFTLEDIKELAQFHGSFSLFSRQEVGFLDSASFLSGGQLLDCPVLCLFHFTNMDLCTVAVRCAHKELRTAVLQATDWQLS